MPTGPGSCEPFLTWWDLTAIGGRIKADAVQSVWFRVHRPTHFNTLWTVGQAALLALLSSSGVTGELGTSHLVLQLLLFPGGLLRGGRATAMGVALCGPREPRP